MARPSKYTEKLAEEICDAIASTPRGLDFICSQNPKFPAAKTVHAWLLKHEEFRKRYLRAREAQADYLFDECLEIADNNAQDTIFAGSEENQFEIPDKEWILRSKLRVDTRMRMAGKLAPKKYGDKIEHDLTPAAGDTLKTFFKALRAGQ